MDGIPPAGIVALAYSRSDESVALGRPSPSRGICNACGVRRVVGACSTAAATTAARSARRGAACLSLVTGLCEVSSGCKEGLRNGALWPENGGGDGVCDSMSRLGGLVGARLSSSGMGTCTEVSSGGFVPAAVGPLVTGCETVGGGSMGASPTSGATRDAMNDRRRRAADSNRDRVRTRVDVRCDGSGEKRRDTCGRVGGGVSADGLRAGFVGRIVGCVDELPASGCALPAGLRVGGGGGLNGRPIAECFVLLRPPTFGGLALAAALAMALLRVVASLRGG